VKAGGQVAINQNLSQNVASQKQLLRVNYDDLKKHLQREANVNQISSNVNVAQQFYSRQKKSVTN